jgi:hypothetical protein
MRDLNSFNGIAGGSLTLTAAYGINDAGQVVGEASVVGGIKSRPFLATLDTVVWENRFGGNWDGTDGWSAGIKPNANTAVFLDPAASLTVTGPAGAVTVKTLNIGGDASGNNGNATLNLAGSAITVTGNAGSFTTVSAKGVLSGDGLITGPVTNLGTVDATNLSLPGGLSNAGTVAGKGRLTAAINNLAGGTVRVAGGERLNLIGNAGNASGGTFDLSRGGELQVNGTLTNNLGGRLLLADGSRLGVSGGLTNNGQLLMSYGTAELFGNIVTNSGGKLILSGTSNTVFYDAVDIKSGGELRVSAGSTATFFGLVSQRTGSLFTGTGTKFYEGGLRIGASPGLGIDEGNVSLGAGNLYLEELGGIDSGTGYDAYHVTGQLSLGGTLKLVSWQGFTAQAGQQFDLFDWGSVSGAFDSIDSSGLLLADGTQLDTSRLTIDGSIRITAVPEPAGWLLMLTGLAGLGRHRNRLRHQAFSAAADGMNRKRSRYCRDIPTSGALHHDASRLPSTGRPGRRCRVLVGTAWRGLRCRARSGRFLFRPAVRHPLGLRGRCRQPRCQGHAEEGRGRGQCAGHAARFRDVHRRPDPHHR